MRLGLVALWAALGFIVLAGGAALGYWISTDASNPSYALAGSVSAGQLPTTIVSGRDVTLSWTGATNANGYTTARSNVAPQSLSTLIGGTCTGTISTTSCNDVGVPENGSVATHWTYTDTPSRYSWLGATSASSAQVNVPAPSLTLGTSSFTTAGGTTSATAASYFDNESVTYCLDASSSCPAGSTLGTANVPATGGTVTTAGLALPAGVAVGAHTIYAIGSLGSLGSASITVSVGTATHLAFSVQPSAVVAGVTIAPAVSVSVEDAFNNVVTSDNTTKITLAMASGGGTLVGGAQTTVSSGVSTFAAVTTTSAGVHTLAASDTTGAGGGHPYTAAVSSSFTVSGASATSFAVANPSVQTAGTSFALVVTAQDTYGNTATSFTGTQSLTITGATNAPDTTAPTLPTSASFSNGVASVSGVVLTNAVSTNLTVTQGSITGSSGSFNVNGGVATDFTVDNPGTQTVGTPFSLGVTALDTYGNTATSFTGTQSVAITGATNSPNSTAPTLPTSASFVSGGATVSGVVLTNAVSTNLTVTQGSIAGTSGIFSALPSAATSFAVINPSTQTVGTSFALGVTALDTYGNTAISFTGTQSLTITGATNSPNSTAPTLPTSASFVSGGATVSGIVLTNAVSTNLTVAQGSIAGASGAFTVNAGVATSFSVANPGSQVAGTSFSLGLTALDTYANTATSFTGTQSLTITGATNSPNSTAPTLPTSGTFSSGVASVSGVVLTNAAPTSLTVAQGALTGTSSAFSVSPTANATSGHTLSFTTQTTGVASATATTVWTTQPAVTVLDTYGNVATAWSSNVGLARATGSGTLTCTSTTIAPTSGVATFAGCHGSVASAGWSLVATSTSATSATSATFSISGVATKIAFSTSAPSTATNTVAFTTTPVAAIEDSAGIIVTSGSTYSVTLANVTGTGSITGCSANPVTTNAGVAPFTGCAITGLAGTHTISATTTGLTTNAVTSGNIALSAGAATQLAFTTQPGGGASNASLAAQPVVKIEDVSGNVTTSTATVSLSIATQPGSGAAISCTSNPLVATAGTATFAGCKIVGQIGTYSLSATSSGLTSATSNTLTLTFGAATQLVFTTQPGGGANNSAWTTQPLVTVEDSAGNTNTSSSASVTLSIATQPGSGATLTCTSNPKAAAAGTATFAGCKIVGQVGSYTIQAAATGLTPAVSGSFSITTGIAAKVVLTTQPGGGANAAAWLTQPVAAIEDSGGNVLTGSSASITLSIATQPGSGATLACTANPLATTAGVATFAGCNIVGKIGSYTLTAASSGLTSATSSALTITVGTATQLAFTTQPVGGSHGATWATQPVVALQDSGGNTVTSTASVTLAINTQPGFGAALSCTTNPLAMTGGVATFAGCKITGGSSGTYTIKATGAFSVVSSSFSS